MGNIEYRNTCQPGYKEITVCVPIGTGNFPKDDDIIRYPEEITCPMYIKHHRRLNSNEIKAIAHSRATEHGSKKVDEWNSSPEGIKYKFHHVNVLKLEHEHSETGADWNFWADIIYELYYENI